MATGATSLMTGTIPGEGSAPDSPNGEEAETPKIDFLKDEKREMTFGRIIALKLMKYSWYYPQPKDEEKQKGEEGDSEGSAEGKKEENEGGKDENEDEPPRIVDDFEKDIAFEKPSLEKGWAFFEHHALCRYSLPKDYKEKDYSIWTRMYRSIFKQRNKEFKNAEPGEDEERTRLYPANTPHNQLGDFGLGIGLYFSNLRALIFVSILCGCISLGNILYYASSRYDENGDMETLGFRTFAIKGSAACSTQVWVPCPTCECDIFRGDDTLNLNRCAVATNTTQTFALKNECDGTIYMLAASNFATVVCMVVCIFVMGRFMKKEEEKFDVGEQTAQDYSVQITNPPHDAKDPEEWRNFFKENFDGAEVVVCTCAVENDLLVRSLVKRREIIRTIHSIQPGESIELLDIAKTAARIERERGFWGRFFAKVIPGIPEYYTQLVALKGKVEGLAQLHYPVTNVFLTFETEVDQRKVLKNLSVGYNNAKKNNKSALSDPKFLFRGEHVLDVCEPEEPDTIQWDNLNASRFKRIKQQVYTLIFTLIMLTVVFVVVFFVDLKNPVWATYAISIFNVIFPMIANAMTEHLESHQSESQIQASLYYKIVLFRWVTTAFIFYTIIPFTDTISFGANGLITRVYLQYFADITTTNILQLLDIPGHLNRHILAPRAKTQDQMNNLFKGAEYELAERYTDMTKILFLTVFYSSIFPQAYFLCAISLIAKYFVDRFALLRTWKRAPKIGPTISSISRKYFFLVAVAVMAIISSYYWTGFPFDNLCIDEDSPVQVTGEFKMSPYPTEYKRFGGVLGSPITTATVSPGDFNYKFCSQDFSAHGVFPFVPTSADNVMNLDPYEYMTMSQLISTTYFGWSAFALLLVIIGRYFNIWYRQYQSTFKGGYRPVGEAQETRFSEVTSRCGYIPQVNSASFAFPLIACQIDDIDEELFDFKDPSRSYLYYDLTNDAEKLVSANKKNTLDESTFTIVKSWPAEKKEN